MLGVSSRTRAEADDHTDSARQAARWHSCMWCPSLMNNGAVAARDHKVNAGQIQRNTCTILWQEASHSQCLHLSTCCYSLQFRKLAHLHTLDAAAAGVPPFRKSCQHSLLPLCHQLHWLLLHKPGPPSCLWARHRWSSAGQDGNVLQHADLCAPNLVTKGGTWAKHGQQHQAGRQLESSDKALAKACSRLVQTVTRPPC